MFIEISTWQNDLICNRFKSFWHRLDFVQTQCLSVQTQHDFQVTHKHFEVVGKMRGQKPVRFEGNIRGLHLSLDFQLSIHYGFLVNFQGKKALPSLKLEVVLFFCKDVIFAAVKNFQFSIPYWLSFGESQLLNTKMVSYVKYLISIIFNFGES